MKIIGTLVYDPIARATGRDRTRIIRRNIQTLHTFTRAYTPYLQSNLLKAATKYDRIVHDDPHYWIRQKEPIADRRNISGFYKFATELSMHAELRVHPDITRLLKATVKTIEDDLIISRMDPGWAILRVDNESVRPWLEEIRSKGNHVSYSIWRPHISIIRGENGSSWNVEAGKNFTVEVKEEIRRNRRGYYWLDVNSTELEELRINMGLSPKPSPPFHLTIGKAS